MADRLIQFTGKHGFTYGGIAMVAALGLFFLAQALDLATGSRDVVSIGMVLFAYGAIVLGLASARWLVLKLTWQDRVWGYTCEEAHQVLAVKEYD